jgi:hypothetical protein
MGEVKFPFTRIGKSYLGEIYRPFALVQISSIRIKDWIPTEAVVDTGADYTLFPYSYATLLAIDTNRDCKADTTLGVGGSETIYLCKDTVLLKLGHWKKTIPVGFLERNDVPMLIGRLGCLEVFKLIFENKETLFSFPT